MWTTKADVLVVIRNHHALIDNVCDVVTESDRTTDGKGDVHAEQNSGRESAQTRRVWRWGKLAIDPVRFDVQYTEHSLPRVRLQRADFLAPKPLRAIIEY